MVNTIFSFVDHTKSREIATSQNTETALAELYAQVRVNNIAKLSKETRIFKFVVQLNTIISELKFRRYLVSRCNLCPSQPKRSV